MINDCQDCEDINTFIRKRGPVDKLLLLEMVFKHLDRLHLDLEDVAWGDDL